MHGPRLEWCVARSPHLRVKQQRSAAAANDLALVLRGCSWQRSQKARVTSSECQSLWVEYRTVQSADDAKRTRLKPLAATIVRRGRNCQLLRRLGRTVPRHQNLAAPHTVGRHFHNPSHKTFTSRLHCEDKGGKAASFGKGFLPKEQRACHVAKLLAVVERLCARLARVVM